MDIIEIILPFKKLRFGSVLYYCGVTVNFYCGSDLVLTSDAVFIHKNSVLMRRDTVTTNK